MEKGFAVPVLDHGYLKFIDSWGSDESVVEAARMSTGKGFLAWGPHHVVGCPRLSMQGVDCPQCEAGESHSHLACECPPGDEKLLRFLYTMKHMTPFEMGGLTIEVQAPIFVFREWHRHRTQSYNEMSARYTPLPDVNYVPTVERLMINSKTNNKQAGTVKGAEELTEVEAINFRNRLQNSYTAAQALYEFALARGVPKELARIHLPVGRYSRMRASANLRNWLAFLTLRMDTAAQWEIRMYANAVGKFIERMFPHTWQLFKESYDTEHKTSGA